MDKAKEPLKGLWHEQDWGGFDTCVICGAAIGFTQRRVSLSLAIEVIQDSTPDEDIHLPVANIEEAKTVVNCCASNSECYPKLEAILKLALVEL